MTNNSKRKQLLGRSFTYARNELHRTLLFHFIKELKKRYLLQVWRKNKYNRRFYN
jgi:hypothetical protein